VTVTNTGKMAGAEVVQVYVKQNVCKVRRPEKELKGFGKVWLAPGESRRVEVPLNSDSFKYYSEAGHGWVLDPGKFTILCGGASDDVRVSGVVEIK